MRWTECPPDVRPGDIVRCMSVVGLCLGTALAVARYYVVCANHAQGDGEPFEWSRRPAIELREAPFLYAPFRFELVLTGADAALASKMADFMRETEASAGACMEADLLDQGFSAEEIERVHEAAEGLAFCRSIYALIADGFPANPIAEAVS